MRLSGLALAALLVGTPALAAPEPTFGVPTEKLSLKPHRVKGLLLGYGYTVGEYTGEVRSRASSVRSPIFNSGSAKTSFTISSPRLPQPVTVNCAGGQSSFNIAGIDFKTQDLKYLCTFEGGPKDASFALALSQAGMGSTLYQPQRAAQLTWGGVTVRAITRKVAGALPLGGGRVMSYRLIQGDRDVGGLVRGVMQPTFYLPKGPPAERDAAAVMALALFFFQDPADRS